MPDLPKVRQPFEADGRGYSAELRRMAGDADKFSDKNDKAALAARRMGIAAKEAADKAARAMSQAGEAAEKLAMGEISADEAAQAEAKALREVERAALKAAEAELAASRAADQAADNFRQLGRDAELAAAASHLAALKQVGDVKSYNAALGNLRKTHKDFTGTALEGFHEIEDKGSAAFQTLNAAGEQVAKAGPAWIVGIVNGIALLPEASAVAGEGITLGLGGALAGIGLKATAGYDDVKRTFSKLKTDVGSEVREISGPFHETWLHIAADARVGFGQIKPALADANKELAPEVSSLSTQLTNALSGPRMQAAVEAIGHDGAIIMDSFGPAVSGAIGDVADGVKSLSDAAAANPGALAGLVSGIGQLTKYSLEGIGVMIRYKSAIENTIMTLTGGGPLAVLKFASSVKDGTRWIFDMGHGLETAGVQQFPTFSQQATAAAAATGHLMTAQQAATLTTQQLKTALDQLTGANQSAFDAETNYKSALLAATEAGKASNAGFKGNSAAAVQNRQALSSLAQAIKGVETTSHPSAQAIEQMRQKLINAAVSMGSSRAEARKLADQLLGVTKAANTIPPRKNITVTSNADYARARINAVRAALNALQDKTINITTYYRSVDIANRTSSAERGSARGDHAEGGYIHRAAGGPIGFFPAGGPVSGPGTSTSDSIPAMLSDGEYVVNAEQTKKYRGLLDAINYKLDGFAAGGAVKTPKQLQTAMASAQKKEAKYKQEERHWHHLYGEYHAKYEAHHTARYRKAEQHALERERHYHKLAAEQAALYKKYKHEYDMYGRPTQAEVSPLPAKLRARPEYLAAMAAQQSLEAMRASMYGGLFRGGASPIGSAHGTVVQHVHNVTVHVAGSVRSDQELAQVMQREFLRYRLSMQLPAGR